MPTGDAAIVFHTGCTTDVPFKITDANGEPVPFELEMLDDGVVLVKTDEALTPGTYQVETPDGAQKTMTVTDPVPLPATLGTLHKDGDCGARFLLTFDDAVVPYLPLMRLEYSVDGGPRSVWFEYGTIPSEGAARLEIAGIPHGNHRLEVFGLVAGEAMGPDALSQAFWAKPCTSDLEDNDRTFCSLDPGRAGAVRSGGGTALALFGVAVAVTRRRRRSPAAR